MNKFIVKTPIDEHTCDMCRARLGETVKDVQEAQSLPDGCENPDGCRCYVEFEDL